jgi:hypothetical protein
MKILLANLGNRNIKYKGSTYTDLSKEEKETINFKEWTKHILDNYAQSREELDINILNPLVVPKGRFDVIYLFASDQSSLNTRTNQDTLYVGEILQKLLCERYQYLEGDIKLITMEHVSVVNNGHLMRFFKKALIKIKKAYKDSRITICDAGGTPQQKMALKVMAEYILKKESYTVKYATKNELVDDVDVHEYRKVIDSEIAIQFLHKGEYNSVLDLLQFNDIHEAHKNKNWKNKLVAHVYFRFRGNHVKARSNLSGNEQSQILSNYYTGVDQTSLLNEYTEVKAYDRIKTLDFLRKAHFYFKNKRFSDSVLSYSQFYESLLDLVLKNLFDSDLYGSKRKQTACQKENLLRLIKKERSEALEKNQWGDDLRFELGDLSTQLLISEIITTGALQDYFIILSKRMEYSFRAIKNDQSLIYINKLRNKVAHDGLYISEEDMNTTYSYFPELLEKAISILELTEVNLFESLNQLIEDKVLRA